MESNAGGWVLGTRVTSGLYIPSDIMAFAGLNNLQESLQCEIPLTTLKTPVEGPGQGLKRG